MMVTIDDDGGNGNGNGNTFFSSSTNIFDNDSSNRTTFLETLDAVEAYVRSLLYSWFFATVMVRSVPVLCLLAV